MNRFKHFFHIYFALYISHICKHINPCVLKNKYVYRRFLRQITVTSGYFCLGLFAIQ